MLLAEREVDGDRVAEHIGVLQHEADAPAQLGKAQVAQLDAVELDRPAARQQQAGDALGERRLARSRPPDERHGRTGLDVEGDVLHDRPVGCGRVGEPHASQPHAALELRDRP